MTSPAVHKSDALLEERFFPFLAIWITVARCSSRKERARISYFSQATSDGSRFRKPTAC